MINVELGNGPSPLHRIVEGVRKIDPYQSALCLSRGCSPLFRFAVETYTLRIFCRGRLAPISYINCSCLCALIAGFAKCPLKGG